jgi:hypothetical protein
MYGFCMSTQRFQSCVQLCKEPSDTGTHATAAQQSLSQSVYISIQCAQHSVCYDEVLVANAANAAAAAAAAAAAYSLLVSVCCVTL